MTDDELKAIKARADAASVKAFDRESAWEALSLVCTSQMDVSALIAEVGRLRRHSVALKKLLALNSVRVEPQSEADADAAAVLQAALRSDDMVDDVLEMYVNSVVKMCR